MAPKKINPMLKSALELGPVILFFIAYLWFKDEVYTINGTDYGGFILVTAGLVPLLALSTALLWKLTGKLSRMQIMTLVLVILFGGLTVWLNDDRFIKIKPTIVFLIFAGILGIGLLRGQSYLQFVMEEMMPLADEGWMILTKRLALFFFSLAVANELVWRLMSTEIWVYFDTFGHPAAMFAFFMTQGKLFERYSPETEENSDTAG